jgi:polysaccharide pyruvyl transferase WcaK-like protein
LAAAIEKRGHGVEVYDFGAQRTTPGRVRTHGNRTTDLVAAVRRNDAVIVGGGTMLQDDQPGRLIAGLPRLCATITALSRINRRPVAYFGVGFDSVNRWVSRKLIDYATSGVPLWLRDADSVGRYRAQYGRQAYLGADAALLLDRTLVASEASPGRNLVVALNKDDGPGPSPDVILRWLEHYDDVIFIAMDQESGWSDGHALRHDVVRMLNYRFPVLGWQDAASLISSAGAVVASRMHALYLALLFGVPSSAIGRREKVTAFAKEFDIPICAHIDEFVPGSPRLADSSAILAATRRANRALDDALNVVQGCSA